MIRIATIIGISGAAGAGKSTAAKRLVDRHGFVRVRFAGPLKAMLAALGLSEHEIEGRFKEAPCLLLGGRTPRHAMQTLGTEWGRVLIDPDLWLRAWQRSVDAAVADGAPGIVADDVRFPNEAQAIRALGGSIWRIDRSTASASASPHVSESQTLGYDRLLSNDGPIAALEAEVDRLSA